MKSPMSPDKGRGLIGWPIFSSQLRQLCLEPTPNMPWCDSRSWHRMRARRDVERQMARKHEGGISYQIPAEDYFDQRELRRHAGVFYLWALGVAAVISGDFSGWNLGFSVGGWGGMFIGTIIITIMYLGLTYSIAEMSPALPHTGGAYSSARTAFGPWGGFITGVAESIEYVLTRAVIVYFIGTYLTAIFETPPAFEPVWWVLG